MREKNWVPGQGIQDAGSIPLCTALRWSTRRKPPALAAPTVYYFIIIFKYFFLIIYILESRLSDDLKINLEIL